MARAAKLLRHPAAVSEWPVVDFRRAEVRRAALLIAGLTAVNIVIILLAGYGGLHAMETPGFCGQACHTPMHPQFQAWQGAVHSGVACVECHIGEGAAAFVHAKLSGCDSCMHGRRQHRIRADSARRQDAARRPGGTCKGCHKPGRVDRRSHPRHPRVCRRRSQHRDDDGAADAHERHDVIGACDSLARGSSVRVEYVATDAERQTIPYVRVTDAKGQVKEYVAEGCEGRGDPRRPSDARWTASIATTRSGIPISPTPEQAVDRAIAAAMVSHDLPFARRESIRLVKATYPSQEAGVRAIEEGLRSFYQTPGGSIDQQALTRTVGAVQELYRRNVFPAMKVTWGSYPDNKGHITSNGCFRCHDDSHEAKDGSKISGDCEYCHKQLETQP